MFIVDIHNQSCRLFLRKALSRRVSGFLPVPHISGVHTWLNPQNFPWLHALLSVILFLCAATGLTLKGGSTSAKSPSPAATVQHGLLWIEAHHSETSLCTKWCVRNTSGVLGHDPLFLALGICTFLALGKADEHFSVTAVCLTHSHNLPFNTLPLDTVENSDILCCQWPILSLY